MSTFKKVISLVLCFTMLLGTVAIAGDLFAPKAAAADAESQVESYADLKTQYGDFMYYGIDVMEYDVNGDEVYTDFYVNPGDTLKILHYIKSTRYISSTELFLEFDSDFFDISNNGADYDSTAMTVNANHPMVSGQGYYADLTTMDLYGDYIYDGFGYTEEYTSKVDGAGIIGSTEESVSTEAGTATADLHLIEQTVKVKAGLADGTTGGIRTIREFWVVTDYKSGFENTDLNYDISQTTYKVDEQSTSDIGDCYYAFDIPDEHVPEANYILDVERTFTIGNPPADGGDDEGGSSEPVETVSQVESYADLKAQYGDFMYYGIDVMETVDGVEDYTDFYVNPGDTLKILHYIKSTRYISSTELFLEFDSDFFDISNNGADYDSTAMTVNANHPMVSGQGYYADLTTMDLYGDYIYDGFGYTEEYTSKVDGAGIIGSTEESVSTEAGTATADLHLIEQTVKVKAGLADGTTGGIRTIREFWVVTDYKSGFENTDLNYDISQTVYKVDEQSTSDIGDCYYAFDIPDEHVPEANYILDVERTFTIGNPPSQGGTVVLPKAIFVENDGTEISSNEYEEGAAVAIPDAAANQIGWANVATGAVVESLEGYTMPSRTVTFQRVLSTDKFDITLDADDAEFETLPEGVTDNGDGTLTVKAGIGETVSFDDIAAEKTGYTGKWNPAEVTLDNIKGAKVELEWVAKTYNVKFYATKGDETSVTNVEVIYDEYIEAPEVTKEGFNFVEWKSVEDDSAANFDEPYTVDGDSAYYAIWSECDSSIKFMAMDYATGEWKEVAKVIGNKGETFAKSKVQAIVDSVKANPENLGWDGTVIVEAGFAITAEGSTSKDRVSDLTFDGHSTYYINTKIEFAVEWNIPKFDEDADAYGTEFEKVTATVKSNFNTATATATIASDKYAPIEGFALKAWNTADGAAATNWAESGKNITFTLNAKDGAAQSYTAVYGAAEYKVTFAIQDITNSIYTLTTTVSVGDTLSLEGAKVIANGAEKDLIAVGTVVVNEVSGKEGYKLIGWKLGATAVEFPLEITLDFVKNNVKNGTIAFTSAWEAQAFDATFEYIDADGNKVTFVVPNVVLDTLFEEFAPGEEKIAEINACAPEGKVFDYWENNGKMTAGGRTFTAVYTSVFFNAYVDYGDGSVDEDGKITFEEFHQGCAAFGDDIWKDGAEDNKPGIGHRVVKVITWGEGNMPGKNYLPTGWDIYYLDENGDPYDESTWKSGVNEEGTGIAKYDLVFRANWKAYNEFFFRVNDTSNNTYCALGKNFKMYYFSNGRAAEKEDAVLNKTDSTIIIFFKPVLENFSWDGFFKKEMWDMVCLRLDPVALPKSMFTVAGMTGLFRAAIDAIGNLIKGA